MTACVGEAVGKGEHSSIARKAATLYSCYEISVGVSQEAEN